MQKEHPKQTNPVNTFFGGCIQARETGEALWSYDGKADRTLTVHAEIGESFTLLSDTYLLSGKGKYQSVQLLHSRNQRDNS